MSEPLKIFPLILFLFLSLMLHGQGKLRTIDGYVYDKKGVPIESAGVLYTGLNGKPEGVVTDSSGYFKIDCPQYVKSLTVRMLGFSDYKLDLGQDSRYSVVLAENSESVADVVVTGYVDRKKNSYTGSIYTIRRAEIENLVHSNVLEIIRLKTPGFEITEDITNGSNPNKLPEMILRGRSSFVEEDNTNVPLFVLDGSEVNIASVFDLPVEDIESIFILKDASATSFYGAKAANGVVVITTRPTSEGRLQLSYSCNMQVSVPDLSDYHLLNAADKLEYEKLVGLYGNFSGSSSSDIAKQKQYYAKKDRVNKGVDTDWKRMALRTGLNRNHNLLLSGGSKMFRYNISGSYNDIVGVMDKSDRRGLSLRMNLTYGDFRRLFIRNVLSFSRNSSSDVPYGSFSDYVRLNPYDRAYNEDGTLNNDLSFIAANPLYEKNLSSYIRNSSNSFVYSFKYRWNIISCLRAEGTLSCSLGSSIAENFISPLSKKFYFSDPAKRGSFYYSESRAGSVSGNAFLVFDKKWQEHVLIITTGFNIESKNNKSNSFSSLGVLSDKIDHPSMSIGFATGSHPGGGAGISRMLGGYLNVNYIWNNRFFSDLSIRYEGSSLFGTDNKFAPFGALGFGWNIHNEAFVNSEFVSMLKLRAGLGYVGNAGFSPYQAKLAYRYSIDLQYDNNIGAVPVAMVNPRLRWERSLKRNIGMDFGFFKDRISGSIEAYWNTTNDIVMTIAKPPHIGFRDSKENLGKIRNDGIEFSLRANVLRRESSNMNLFFSMSHNSNRIIEISDYLKNKNKNNEKSSSPSLPKAFYQEGQSMTALKVMISAGINPANGKEVFYLPDGGLTYKYDYRYKQVVGDLTPTVQGAFGCDFSYRNMDFSVTLSYRLGASVFNQTLAMKVEGADPTTNVDRRVFYDRWKQPGDLARFKRIDSREITPATSRFTAKEYALDMASMRISYRIPESFCRKVHVRQLRFALSAGDLFHVSTVRRERGLDYPFARVFQISMSLNL